MLPPKMRVKPGLLHHLSLFYLVLNLRGPSRTGLNDVKDNSVCSVLVWFVFGGGGGVCCFVLFFGPISFSELGV